MRFLYHARPRDLRGGVLYPLSALRTRFPDLYEFERAKYAGRELLFELRIPLLDVLWNEALHLSPFHPSQLAAAWRDAGLPSSAWDRDFFEIPVERVESARVLRQRLLDGRVAKQETGKSLRGLSCFRYPEETTIRCHHK